MIQNDGEEKLVFGKYMRKSSDTEDKQVRSIEDQTKELDDFSSARELDCVKFPGESQSAHSPGRPIFAQVMKALSDGKINALLVWHPNRISRNPVDSGTVIYLMDTFKLKAVMTPSRIYYNTPTDKFVLQLEFSMSKKDSDDKSEAVKRGIKGRASRGYPPTGTPKIGYLVDPTSEEGDRRWVVDKDRFSLVQKLMESMLTGKTNPRKLWTYANKTLKLTTPQRKKLGGKPLAHSFMYCLLRDPVYAGFFYYGLDEDRNPKRYELDKNLPRVINEEDYWKIQAMLGRKGMPKPKRWPSQYNNFMRCGHCGGTVTMDPKFQVICDCKKKFSYMNKEVCPSCGVKIVNIKKPTYLSYIYYNCTKKAHPDCASRSIEHRELEKDLIGFFSNNLTISKELSAWTIKYLDELNDHEIKERTDIVKSRQKAYNNAQKQLDELLSMKLRGMLTDEEYTAKKASLKTEAAEAKNLLDNTDDRATRWRQIAEETFDLATEIVDILRKGTIEEKKDALFKIGSNLTLKDKKLIFSNTNQFGVLIKSIMEEKSKNPSFEPKNIVDTSTENAAFSAASPTWLRGQGSNLGHPR